MCHTLAKVMRKVGMKGTVFHYQSIDIAQKCIQLFAKFAVWEKNLMKQGSINLVTG